MGSRDDGHTPFLSAHVQKKDNFRGQISDLKLSKELKEKLIGWDREGLGLGLGIIDCRSEPDRRSEAITVHKKIPNI